MVERLFLIEAMPQGMGGCMTSVDVVSVDGGYSKCNKCYRGYSGGCCKLTNATKQQGMVLDVAGRLRAASREAAVGVSWKTETIARGRHRCCKSAVALLQGDMCVLLQGDRHIVDYQR